MFESRFRSFGSSAGFSNSIWDKYLFLERPVSIEGGLEYPRCFMLCANPVGQVPVGVVAKHFGCLEQEDISCRAVGRSALHRPIRHTLPLRGRGIVCGHATW